jgi:uncharacterized protein
MEGKEQPGFDAVPYRPARWLPSPHGQTIGGRLLRRPAPIEFRRERVELPDGDFLDLDHPAGIPSRSGAAVGTWPDDDAPLVLLVHGLEGSARRGYAINVYRDLARRGIRSVGLNFRSCSGEPNRLARAYHSGDTGDIRYVLDLLRERQPGIAIGAIGFSLGGNALLKLLGESGAARVPGGAGDGVVRAAVAVSVPYDLGAGADFLETTAVGRFYASRFVRSLIAKAEAKGALLDAHCDRNRIRRARTFREFDDAVTAPLHGFADAADYYEQSSSKHHVAAIRVPTLLLHAEDDPFLPAERFPHAAVAANPAVRAIVTETGGHVGFIEGRPWSPSFWAEREAARFLAERLLVDNTIGRG